MHFWKTVERHAGMLGHVLNNTTFATAHWKASIQCDRLQEMCCVTGTGRKNKSRKLHPESSPLPLSSVWGAS